MRTRVRFEGGAQLAKTLNQLSKGVQKKVLREALRAEVGEPIRARAAGAVNRAPGAPDIADHLVLSNGRGSSATSAAVLVGPSSQTRSDQAGRTFAEQGAMLEFGTAKMRMFPFLRPSFDQVSRDAGLMRRIGSSLWAALIRRGVGSGRGGGGGGGTL